MNIMRLRNQSVEAGSVMICISYMCMDISLLFLAVRNNMETVEYYENIGILLTTVYEMCDAHFNMLMRCRNATLSCENPPVADFYHYKSNIGYINKMQNQPLCIRLYYT